MSLRRRLSFVFASVVGAAALLFASAQPAMPQVRGKGPQASRVSGVAGLRSGDSILFSSPQFVVQALWIKSNDETGWYWTGSDEVYAIFSDMQPTTTDRMTSEYELDEGDTLNFSAADSCMAPQPECETGMADLNVQFSFWESDVAVPGFSYCNRPDSAGRRWRLYFGECIDDDFIGSGEIIHSRTDLVTMLPAVGDSREFTHVMDQNAGKFRFRYRITRLPNVERSIVIHLPPDFDPTPPANITLQAEAITTPQGRRVHLTWTGATTSTVDVFRNDIKVITTANDGDHLDASGNGTFRYRLCNLNSTTVCSPEVTIVVN